MEERKKSIIIPIITFFLGAIAIYLLIYFLPNKDLKQTVINKSEKEVTITDEGIADAVEKVFDSVVIVENYKNDKKAGSGTGFIYKTEGDKAYILTNNHVIEGAGKVIVVLTNKEQIEVEVVGSDQYFDLAVMSIPAEKAIQVAKIGSSTNLRLGDTVFTVGAPLANEYSGTVTRGIVSGKDRIVPVSIQNAFLADYMMRVIQTDASINAGNSGGPLSNSNGEVIGVTSLKLVSSGVEGMGFAIPIEDAIQFADVVEKGEKVIRPSLGINIYDVAPASLFNPNPNNKYVTEGAIISSLVDGYPAQKSGLKVGDVIIKMDDNKIVSVASLKYNLYKYKVGDTSVLTVNRAGEEIKFNVKLDKAIE